MIPLMAARVMHGATSEAARIDTLFRLATARFPDDEEAGVLRNRLRLLHEQYETHPGDAADLLAVGDSPVDQTLDPIEHAAWAGLAAVVLNLDETISKQ